MKHGIILTTKIIAGTLAAILLIGWLGLQVRPKCFGGYETNLKQSDAEVNYELIPPAMETYFEKSFKDGIFSIESSIVHGRATLFINGIKFPARFITFYKPAYGFYRYIEITWFGIPVIKGYDLYTEEKAEFCIAGNTETGYRIEQGQNLTLWAESVWFPSIYLQDERLKWLEPDEYDIGLSVPFKNSSDHISMDMDPVTGLISSMEAWRYKGQDDKKQLWKIECLEWGNFNGVLIPSESSVRWADENKPWAYWTIEGVQYNTEISKDFRNETDLFN